MPTIDITKHSYCDNCETTKEQPIWVFKIGQNTNRLCWECLLELKKSVDKSVIEEMRLKK